VGATAKRKYVQKKFIKEIAVRRCKNKSVVKEGHVRKAKKTTLKF